MIQHGGRKTIVDRGRILRLLTCACYLIENFKVLSGGAWGGKSSLYFFSVQQPPHASVDRVELVRLQTVTAGQPISCTRDGYIGC